MRQAEASDLSVEGGEAAGKCVVMKFGGTSVQDAAAIRRLCQLAKRALPQRPVLVVSALAKVTDQLMNAGWAAAEGRLDAARESVQLLRERHLTVASGLVGGDEYDRLCNEFAREFDALAAVLSRIAWEKAFTPHVQDQLLGVGESLSSKLVHAALRCEGVEAALVDARHCIITDAAHTRATPLWDDTNKRLQAVLAPLLNAGKTPVMGGFVGATRDGIPTTLGRGGSDFSASIVGAGLHARRIEIWTDVDGIMTADPALCPDASRVGTHELRRSGGSGLLWGQGIASGDAGARPCAATFRSGCSIRAIPDCAGTEIVAHCETDGRVKAITAKRGVAIVDIEPVRWFAPELLREVFDVFERHQHSLDLLSASRGSLALLVSSVTATAVDCRRTERYGQRALGKSQGIGLPGG